MRVTQLTSCAAIVVVLILSAPAAGQDLCVEMKQWKVAQPLFSKMETQGMLSVAKGKPLNRPGTWRQKAESGNYFFQTDERENVLKVSTGRGYHLRLSVPDYRQRPLEAKWINSKLLLIEVWFNPHYGAYWIYDADEERVVLAEQQDDGLDAWRQCRSAHGRKKRD